jgi:hypothetical protein
MVTTSAHLVQSTGLKDFNQETDGAYVQPVGTKLLKLDLPRLLCLKQAMRNV